MRRTLVGAAAILVFGGCLGDSHTTDRPTVTDCTTATRMGQQRDPCELSEECGAVDGDRLRSAVCDNGVLLTASIETTNEVEDPRTGCGLTGRMPVPGADEGTWIALVPLGSGCIEAVVCREGESTVRAMSLCQVGFTEMGNAGEPWTDCVTAVQGGVDGDPCSGTFACIADKSIGPAGVLPIIGWCDAGLLRLAPSQTLLLGPP